MKRFAPLFLLTFLAACASVRPYSAAGDVHALLVAIRDDDRLAFERRVDRRALRANLQAQMAERARSAHQGAITALALLLSGPAARAVDEVAIQPGVLRGVAFYYGYRAGDRLPGPLAIGATLHPAANGTVCATDHRNGRCLITFADEEGVWRLVDIDLNSAAHLSEHR